MLVFFRVHAEERSVCLSVHLSVPHVYRQPRMSPLQMCRRCSRLCPVDSRAAQPAQQQSPPTGNLWACTVNMLQDDQ